MRRASGQDREWSEAPPNIWSAEIIHELLAAHASREVGEQQQVTRSAINASPPQGVGLEVGFAATANRTTGGHGTALGPAPRRLAAASAPEHLGSGGPAAGAGTAGADRLGRPGNERALSAGPAADDQPRPVEAAGVRAAHGPAHGLGARRLADLQSRLCRTRRQKPPGREDPDPAARCFAVGADPRLFVDHRDWLYRAFPGPAAWGRMRGDIRHFHLAGLEHDVQRLPVAAHGAGRTDRSRAHVPSVAMAALLAARSAACDTVPGLEHDDVGLGWLVLRRRLRGDHGRRPHDPAARHRLLHRDGDREAEPGRDRLGRPRHVRRDIALRSAAVSPAARLVPQIPARNPRPTRRMSGRGF